MSDHPLSIIGQRFGALTIEALGSNGNRRTAICRCDCGARTTATLTDVKRKRTKSCGCLRKRSGIDVPRQSSERGTRGAASSAARQSLEQAWAEAVASAERALAPIRVKVRWEGET